MDCIDLGLPISFIFKLDDKFLEFSGLDYGQTSDPMYQIYHIAMKKMGVVAPGPGNYSSGANVGKHAPSWK